MATTRRVSALALIVGSLGGRIKRSRHEAKSFIAGTPVLNYHLAYAGHANLAEMGEEERAALEQDWLLVMKPETTDREIHRLCKLAKCVREGHPSKGGMPYLEVRSTEAELSTVIGSAEHAVQFVEPDSEMKLIPEIEGDVEAASWGLDRIAAPSSGGDGEGVHIYVLDTGIRASHTDFGGRVIPTLDLSSNTLEECDGDLSCAGDGQGHGTHCAGTAAGSTFGVAPRATLHSVKVLSDSGSGQFSWSYDSLDWLASKGKRPAVASMSLGGPGTQGAMKTAVDTAVTAGVTVVVAGGNDNTDACGFSPAFVPSAITVGSTTSEDVRSSFSNYGICTDIWAPGSNIVSASHTSDTGSRSLSGTSMACPHVSGAVALVLQQDGSLKSPGVLAELLNKAERGAISDLRNGDTNALLFVGEGEAPVPAPTPAPPPSICPSAFSSGPDSDGDCKCNFGRCYESGSLGCTFSFSGRSTIYFLPTCEKCECK